MLYNLCIPVLYCITVRKAALLFLFYWSLILFGLRSLSNVRWKNSTSYHLRKWKTNGSENVLLPTASMQTVQNMLKLFMVTVKLKASPAVLLSNRMCLRCDLPKCLTISRSPPLFPHHHRPSTLHPPFGKPHLLLPFPTTALVPLNRNPLEQTRNRTGNIDWLSYRNRLEDGNWRGREAYEAWKVGGPCRTNHG